MRQLHLQRIPNGGRERISAEHTTTANQTKLATTRRKEQRLSLDLSCSRSGGPWLTHNVGAQKEESESNARKWLWRGGEAANTRLCPLESCLKCEVRSQQQTKYLRDLDTEVGLEGRVQVGIGADIGKGLDNNLGVLLDQEVNGGIEGSANGLGGLGGTLLQGGGLGSDGGAEEHGEHGQEEGEEGSGLHDGWIGDVGVRKGMCLREGER